LQIGVGAALTVVGYFPIVHLLRWLSRKGALIPAEQWLLVFSGIGVWMLASSRRRGHFLEVQTADDRKRFIFGAEVEREDVQEFVEELERHWDVQVARAD
jgi:hypothetical protein